MKYSSEITEILELALSGHTGAAASKLSLFISTIEYEGDVKTLLSKQIESPVRWVTIVMNMIKSGIDTFIEVGPGSTLTGLIKRIDKEVRTYNVSDAESIEKILSEVGNG